MRDQIKWLMGILAGLILAGATAYASSIESRLSDVEQIRSDVQYLKGRFDQVFGKPQ